MNSKRKTIRPTPPMRPLTRTKTDCINEAAMPLYAALRRVVMTVINGTTEHISFNIPGNAKK